MSDAKLVINRELLAYQCDRYGNMRPGIQIGRAHV